MANNERKKYVEVTSPVGTFAFPSLHEPSYGSTEYPKPEGEYKLGLRFNRGTPECEAFLAKLEPHYEEAISQAKEEFSKLSVGVRKKFGEPSVNPLYVEIYDKETEEATGVIEFRIKMPASGVYKRGPKEGQTWNLKPTVYDAGLKRMDPVPNIWGGTQGRVRMALSPYFIGGTALAGLKLQLIAVQVTDLVEGGERSAESLGFEEDAGGYHQPTFETITDTSAVDSGDF